MGASAECFEPRITWQVSPKVAVDDATSHEAHEATLLGCIDGWGARRQPCRCDTTVVSCFWSGTVCFEQYLPFFEHSILTAISKQHRTDKTSSSLFGSFVVFLVDFKVHRRLPCIVSFTWLNILGHVTELVLRLMANEETL